MVYNVSETGVSAVLTVKILEGALGRDVAVVLNTHNGSAFGESVTILSAQDNSNLLYCSLFQLDWIMLLYLGGISPSLHLLPSSIFLLTLLMMTLWRWMRTSLETLPQLQAV